MTMSLLHMYFAGSRRVTNHSAHSHAMGANVDLMQIN